MYTAMLLLAMLWPFTHKQNSPVPPVPTNPPTPTITIGPEVQPGDPVVPESLCSQDVTFGWELRGPDGATGYSSESCQKAFENWKLQPAAAPLRRA